MEPSLIRREYKYIFIKGKESGTYPSTPSELKHGPIITIQISPRASRSLARASGQPVGRLAEATPTEERADATLRSYPVFLDAI